MFTLAELLFVYDLVKHFNSNNVPEKIISREVVQVIFRSSTLSPVQLKPVLSELRVSPQSITFSDVVLLLRAISLLQSSPNSPISKDTLSSLTVYTPPSLSPSPPITPPPKHSLPSSTGLFPSPEAVLMAASSFDKLSTSSTASQRDILPSLQMFKNRLEPSTLKLCWDHFSEGNSIERQKFVAFFCFLGKIAKGEAKGVIDLNDAFSINPKELIEPKAEGDLFATQFDTSDAVPSDLFSFGQTSTDYYQSFQSKSNPMDLFQQEAPLPKQSQSTPKAQPPVEIRKSEPSQEAQSVTSPMISTDFKKEEGLIKGKVDQLVASSGSADVSKISTAVKEFSSDICSFIEEKTTYLEGQKAHHESELKEIKVNLSSDKDRFASLWEQYLSLEKENSILLDKISHAKCSHAEVKAKIKFLQDNISHMEEKNLNHSETLKTLTSQSSTSRELCDGLKRTEKNLKQTSIDHQAELSQTMEDLKEVQEVINKCLSSIKGLRLSGSESSTQSEMIELITTVESLSEELTLMKGKIANQSNISEVSAKVGHLSDLICQISDLEPNNSKISQQLAELCVEAEKILSQTKSFQSQSDDVFVRVKSLSTQFDSAVAISPNYDVDYQSDHNDDVTVTPSEPFEQEETPEKCTIVESAEPSVELEEEVKPAVEEEQGEEFLDDGKAVPEKVFEEDFFSSAQDTAEEVVQGIVEETEQTVQESDDVKEQSPVQSDFKFDQPWDFGGEGDFIADGEGQTESFDFFSFDGSFEGEKPETPEDNSIADEFSSAFS
ncbi:hypothetical protein GEMRC1_003797 [Eukaryota sp. GEM-RC1]